MINNSNDENFEKLEKVEKFSKSVILDNGLYLINIKNEKLDNYVWYKSLLNPKDTFNPKLTKGFIAIRLLLYGYLNRICTYRSNSDDALKNPYLKILLNDIEIYRTKILYSSYNIWNEKIEIEIHCIKSFIEIQLFDMDETDNVIEDEYIGSAFVNICDLKIGKKYDIIIKYINKKGLLINPHKLNNLNEINDNKEFNESNKNIDPNSNILDENKNRISLSDNLSVKRNSKGENKENDYNIRIFIKLINKYELTSLNLKLSTISSIGYKNVNNRKKIFNEDLNVKQIYKDIVDIKLNVVTIWIPFFSIIYQFISWKKPFYSAFFVIFLCLSIIFSKFFLSFFLLSLSLILFVLVSIIKESDKIKLKDVNLLNIKKNKKTKINTKYNYGKEIEKSQTVSKEKRFKRKKKKKKKEKEKEKDTQNEYSSSTINNSEISSSLDESSYDTDSNSYTVSSDNNYLKNEDVLSLSNYEGKRKIQKNIDNEKLVDDNEINNENEETDKEDEEETDEEEENNLEIIKSFISNIIDDEIIYNAKYIQYALSTFMNISNNILKLFRKFGYLLLFICWVLCILNIFFHPIVRIILRFSIFFFGFVFLTYNFKPLHIIYKFFICSNIYYFMKIKKRKKDIYTI